MRSRNRKLSGLAPVAAVLLSVGAATAQDLCMTHEEAVTWLEAQFDERVIGRGLAENGRVMFEVFAGPKGTWTLLVSTPEGGSCIIADGLDWQQLPPRPEGALAAMAGRAHPAIRSHRGAR